MSEIQRSLGSSITSGENPAVSGTRLEPAVRFSPEAQEPQGQVRSRRNQDRLAARPQSWFGSMRLTKDAPQAAAAKAPTPPMPAGASSSAAKKPQGVAAKGKSVDDNIVSKLGYKAGSFVRPHAHYWVGREVVTDQLEDWMGSMINHAAFLGDKNSALVRKNAELETRLKAAEQSVQRLEKHMVTADESLARSQAQSAFFEQFYAGHQATCDELYELFDSSKSAADESRQLAKQGLRLARQFKRPVGVHVATDEGESAGSGSDADSARETFGA